MGMVGQGARALLCGTAITLVAFATFATFAHAQDAAADEKTAAQADKQDRVTVLQRIVVDAGQEKVTIDTPQSVSVVEQQDIDDVQAAPIAMRRHSMSMTCS